MSKVLLEMKNITKLFPGVKALDNVNFSVKENDIHALVGENGAGKSTLMGVLSGVHQYGTYSGEIFFNNRECQFRNIKDSEKEGIVIIHQEFALIPQLSVAENIFLGNENQKRGYIDWNTTHKKAEELLERVGLDVSTNALIKDIGVGKQQLVEIAKALSKEVKLLILDEPTAALNDEEADKLLDLLIQLKAKGISSIIITHKLNEVIKVADAITILRDGATIETLIKGEDEFSEDRIIQGMVGRKLTDRFPKRDPRILDDQFVVKDWNVYDPLDPERKVINNINIHINKGEVVGIAGLMGAGRTELAKSIFGRSYGSKITGEIFKDGKKINTDTVSSAINNGLAYVTEDRKSEGLVLMHDIKSNLTQANLSKISNRGIVDENMEIKESEKLKTDLNIRCSSILQKAEKLSGGNQQKVVFSKWIFTDPDVLMLDEPTRGIDVGAKFEIYTIINELANQGKFILLISSEMEELLGMCDRIYVMNEGRIVGEFSREEATQEKIMKSIIQSNREAV
jgi:putative multiple sugar transport system ATP-binding protein